MTAKIYETKKILKFNLYFDHKSYRINLINGFILMILSDTKKKITIIQKSSLFEDNLFDKKTIQAAS